MKNAYLISSDILSDAAALGISPSHLQEMIARSTRITHALGNRRYHGYLFRVEGNKLLFFGRLDELGEYKCEACKDVGRMPTFDQCGACEGKGCPKCDEGLVPSSIPCPECELGRKSRAA